MNFNDFINRFPIPLNKQQQQAVQAVNGPTLLLAVPGSGKTTVLVARLGYMILCCGIDPSAILTLTYTRAAASDMASRYMALFGEASVPVPEFRTINSICDRIIRFYSERAGKQPFRVESDEKLLGKMIADLYAASEHEYPTENDIRNVRSLITYCKNMRLSPSQIEQLGTANEICLDRIYREYQTLMRRNGKMDYDDQMVYAYNILTKSPQTLAYFQRQYQYICVDEAQDTSKIQHEIIALLAADNENLFLVGDEDQSIYGFRAAYPEALLEFGRIHKGAQVLLMEENFRSGSALVEAAGRLIGNNVFRYEKHMISRREGGAPVRVVSLKGRRAQYTYLLKAAQSVTQKEGNRERTAVLYRNNDSCLVLADLLETNQVPYRMPNRDLLFFTHRTVTDVRSIIAFAADPYNTAAFMQIYYKIGLYIRRNEALEACRVSQKKHIPVLDALENDCSLTRFRTIRVKSVRTNLAHMLKESSRRAISRIRNALEYDEYLEQSGLSDDKLGILTMLSSEEMSPIEFCTHLEELKTRIRTRPDDPSCPFILSTIHSAKGLEYEHVYLIDCADGIFPQSIPKQTAAGRKKQETEQASPDNTELKVFEEERRMFYVAVTRAKNTLTIFDLPQGSIFLQELTGQKVFGENRTKEPAGRTLPQTRIPEKTVRHISDEELNAFKRRLKKGSRVRHRRFGAGVVTEVYDRKIRIRFAQEEERDFNLSVLLEKDLLELTE